MFINLCTIIRLDWVTNTLAYSDGVIMKKAKKYTISEWIQAYQALDMFMNMHRNIRPDWVTNTLAYSDRVLIKRTKKYNEAQAY
jgi:hypothetical protein